MSLNVKPRRRLFLKTAAQSLGIGLLGPLSGRLAHEKAELSDKLRGQLRGQLLEMVNEERVVAGVPAVTPDALATRVADEHALDMAKRSFTSHWGSDGQKPYQRYSFAGGTDAIEENISSASNTWSWKAADIAQDVAYLHVRLYSEKPPNDRHRRSILAPQHTHVGFGLAVEELRLKIVELFVARCIEVAPLKRKAKPRAEFQLAGKVLNPEYDLKLIEVFYEQLLEPPALEWLRTPRAYSLPEVYVQLRPKLQAPLLYADRTRGVVELKGPAFRAPVKLFEKDPGIYTIVVWLKRGSEKPFAATQICVAAE